MNKRLLWTSAVLTATFGALLSGNADSSEVGNHQANTQPTPSTLPSQRTNVVKVGEYNSPPGINVTQTVVTRIQPHELEGRQAATLYVKNIPVLTFLSSNLVVNNNATKVATVPNLQNADPVWRAAAVAAKLNALSRGITDQASQPISRLQCIFCQVIGTIR